MVTKTKTLLGKAYFSFTRELELKYIDFFQHQDNFDSMFLLLHTKKPAIAFYAVQKTQQPTAKKNYNHSLPFKLRNKRCRYGYLAFHSQNCRPSCSVCFSLEIAFNSTKAWTLHRLKNSPQSELAQF